MSKIVFFCIPAHGHTNPTLGVVRQLISRGHEVWYYSYNMMKQKIEDTGAVFVSCDDFDTEQKLEAKDSARIGKDIAFSTKVLVDTTLALDDKVCKDMEILKPDCIVADSMALWGKAVALKLGIPFVCSTTTFAFNKYSSKILKQSIKDLFKMILAMPRINKNIKRLQMKGYPVRNIIDIIGNDNDTHSVVYTSAEFQPCSETFSEKYAFVGPSIRHSNENIDKKADKLIYISMGTVNNDMMPFYESCISAFSKTDFQVIMSVGYLVDAGGFKYLPENITVMPYVDQIAVLKEADVFVSHCGMNSVNESLYFGVPLVMLPQTSEQKGVAGRVSELGAGIRIGQADGNIVLNAVNTVLRDSNYKQNAKSIAEGFRRCSGAEGAADKIIQVCEDNK